jgi:hypothetical protein
MTPTYSTNSTEQDSPEKLIVAHVGRSFPAFYITHVFIAAFIRARHYIKS